MSRIVIIFRDTGFEHDIYELTRAFYPGTEILSAYEETEEDPADILRLTVWKEGNTFCTGYVCGAEKGIIRTVLSEGQAGDAPENAPVCCETDASVAAGGQAVSSETVEQRIARHALRKENKDLLKYDLYQLLVRLTGRTLPWGNLTGIRPAKLAMGMLEEGMNNPEIAAEMRSRYLVSPEKTALAVTIANREKEILKNIDYKRGYSLYGGIPFCPSICLYCSFSSYPLEMWKEKVDDYLRALVHEITEVSAIMRTQGRRLDTVYIGGGTPTTLEPDQLRFLLHALTEAFPVEEALEFTLEAGRPDSITRDKLAAISEYPVTRISVNPQTMNQVTLDVIGRRHTVEQTKEAFYLARECGFDDINMDLIIGLPGEGKAMVEHTLDEIRKLGPDSLTVHSLAVKRAARLNIFRDQYKEMTFENNQEILSLTMKAAYEMGMGPYYLYRQKNMKGNFENVGYAKVDKAGIYNILIMEEKEPIIAVGAGGSSKLVCDGGHRIERVSNVKDVDAYIGRIDEMIERKRKGIAANL